MDLDHVLLSPDREIELLRRAARGDRAARDTVIEHNQRLVMGIALHYFHCGYAGDQEIDDLVQWGNFGLLHAANKYDPQMGTRFSTYAVPWIKFYIRRFAPMAGNFLTLSFRDTEYKSRIRRSRARLMQQKRREPTAAEIATETGIQESTVEIISGLIEGPIRLDQSSKSSAMAAEGDADAHEYIADPQCEQDLNDVEYRVMLGDLRDAASQLPEPIRSVIHRYYFQDPPATYDQIGRDFGFSGAYAQQLAKKGINALRRMLTERCENPTPAQPNL